MAMFRWLGRQGTPKKMLRKNYSGKIFRRPRRYATSRKLGASLSKLYLKKRGKTLF